MEAIAHTADIEGFDEVVRPRRMVLGTGEPTACVMQFEQLVEQGVRERFTVLPGRSSWVISKQSPLSKSSWRGTGQPALS